MLVSVLLVASTKYAAPAPAGVTEQEGHEGEIAAATAS